MEVNRAKAHSLYTTNDRGVNEVAPHETSRALLREQVPPVYRTITIDETRTMERDRQDPERSRRGFDNLRDVCSQKRGRPHWNWPYEDLPTVVIPLPCSIRWLVQAA